ncbi:exopolysaccharide biosynthesis glycosyltransferase EpsD [Chloroflexus aggregans]|uniref:Glycosyl transferase family 2 n=1 Tax=Chloroflexus aggregans (strain MD-66 / DSM 9485) TaxID=326427 RepID=B8G375_CHLAD|nr:exopolysaccharide biosynthesis glycosyltransferase EpsD [Chloroflexus aggregans]ACL25248.1 glycosyl transferase family 2 [Chloroflexus aggregans DSM 9485]
MNDLSPTVSIVIPTYNRCDRLQRVLAALAKQTYPHTSFEVVIVSDGSTDGTAAFCQYAQTPFHLQFIQQANAGPAAARNRGVAAARGTIILFLDDDVVPAPNLIAEHMRLHSECERRIVLGPMLTPPDARLSPWVAWEQAMLEKQYRAMTSGIWPATARQFYTGNTSLARQLVLAAGGFDERFRRAEDIELAYRLNKLGVEFVFAPQAIGYHYADRSFTSWLATPYAYGRNDIIFGREQQVDLLGFVRREFAQRNQLTRWLVWVLLDRPRASALVLSILPRLALLAHRLFGERGSRPIYSAIFNLRYYQGVADELGGRDRFFAMPTIVEATQP